MFKKQAENITIKVPELSLRTVELPPAVSEGVQFVRQKKQDAITRILNYEHTPIITAAAVGFLTGVIVGFAFSPVKHGVKMFSENAFDSHEVSNTVNGEEEEDEALPF